LGLAIWKAIVESHGGQITATSISGSGSTFTVILPNSAWRPEGTTRTT
jgi:signal transduction histidine kinase